jgi:cell wall-associated NlpC family hydrolase
MRALGLFLLVAMTTSACASSGAVPRPTPPPAAPDAPPAREAGRETGRDADLGHRIVADALELRGAPYRNGGADPAGFDCSGFVRYVLGRHGIAAPRQTSAQFAAGRPVRPEDVRAGDLLFFTTVAPGASHVAIAIDQDEFVHAPSSRGVVRVERLALPYWRTRFVGARRLR